MHRQSRYILACLMIIESLLLFSCNARAETVFDGHNAYEMLKKQCSFGPRVPGTASHTKCVNYLTDYLKQYADTVYIQSFKRRMSYADTLIEFKNIIAEFNASYATEIMLASHYDSRPFSSVKGKPTPGANDGASSTAVLMEIARQIHSDKPEKAVTLVFFDGEDGGRNNHPDEWFIGSKYFAEHCNRNIPDICILIDMIGDIDLAVYREGFSEIFNSELNTKVFGIAQKLGKTAFINEVGYFVQDDHIPLNNAGFRCIDLIDWHYEYWHTPEDTPDKCSPSSLQDIGDILMEIIYE